LKGDQSWVDVQGVSRAAASGSGSRSLFPMLTELAIGNSIHGGRGHVEFDLLSLDVVAGQEVAFAHGLLRCGTPEGSKRSPTAAYVSPWASQDRWVLDSRSRTTLLHCWRLARSGACRHALIAEVSTSTMGVPAALIPVGASVSHPKERLDGHALGPVPLCGGETPHLTLWRLEESSPRADSGSWLGS
jgi:hypothetical protein